MTKLLYFVVALAAAASAQPANDTPTSTLSHRKMFNFLYGSSDRDDLEVDVNANAPDEDHDDSADDDELRSGSDTLLIDVSPQDPANNAANAQQGSPNVAAPANDGSDVTSNALVVSGVQQDVQKSVEDTPDHAAYPTNAHIDDVVWVTRYSYESVTIPLPTADPVTETDYETVTQQQTVTQVDVFTATVTIPAGSTPSADAFHQGYDQGYSAGQWNCVANATETGATGEQAYDEGYIDGAHWGYRLGYSDAAARRPFALPEFASPTPAAPAYPTAAYPPSPTAYPYGYGYQYPGYGYPGYAPPQAPQAPPPAPPPAPPAAPPPAPPPVSYTTISYFVPYEPYNEGYPYAEEATANAPEAAIVTATGTPAVNAAVASSA